LPGKVAAPSHNAFVELSAPRTVEYFHAGGLPYTAPYALPGRARLVLRESAGGDPGTPRMRDRGTMAAIAGRAAAAALIIYRR
jgi:hypothetical protein